MSDLIDALRSLAKRKHDDLSLAGDAADEIERLTAERDALRADAERYRWLRASDRWPLTVIGPGDVLDAKIDAARDKP